MAIPTSVFAQSTERDVLRRRLETLSSSSSPAVGGAPIAAAGLIAELCERRAYEPAWTDWAMVEQLFDQVRASAEHGLNPVDFHERQLSARMKLGALAHDPGQRADTEILCLDALVRLAVSLRFGKLDPAGLDSSWNFSRRIQAEDPVTVFENLLNEKNVAAALEEASPNTPFYRWLRRALADHRHIQTAGGWPRVPDGDLLETGSQGPRVATLRARLEVTGDLAASDSADSADSAFFDEALEAGVMHFSGSSRHQRRRQGRAAEPRGTQCSRGGSDRPDKSHSGARALGLP